MPDYIALGAQADQLEAAALDAAAEADAAEARAAAARDAVTAAEQKVAFWRARLAEAEAAS